ncbi:MAG: 30S ribosomal protein S4, small subunit ribosomal protein S4 [Microgenomates group bacterium GW2011_GWC1_39_7b]|nr:MAG: 30S ribosomal protein S4, small subunit ribosomal protein S4 [Microgenomates group bacterium GW2011_GWC1_39_7b]
MSETNRTMARYTGPKDRLSRRENFDIFSAGTKLTRLNVPPGVHGAKGTRGSSQFGRQLREKQKVKRIYGLMEAQFRRYVDEAAKTRGNTGEALLISLEERLDNVVFRLGFAPSRPAARQLVSHRHVLVNGKKLNIPSYKVKVGDTVGIDSKAIAIPEVKSTLDKLDKEDFTLPGWLDRKAAVGKIVKAPVRADIVEPISEQDIVEFYSR